MRAGRSLDELGYSLSWIDLAAFLKWADPDSAFKRKTDPMSVWKKPLVQLASNIFDWLRVQAWARSGGEDRGIAQPRPFLEVVEEQIAPKKPEALELAPPKATKEQIRQKLRERQQARK